MRYSDDPRNPRERGAALIVALVAVVALLGIGMVTMLAVRSDTSASASDRFQQIALYAAESGAYAGIDFLRNNCKTDGTFFTQFLGTSPSAITGNGIAYGATGNAFTTMPGSSYTVSIKNNAAESSSTVDSDGVVVLRSVGLGPNSTQVIVEVEVSSPTCISAFCATAYAQAFNNSSNNNTSVCATTITASSLRSATP